VRSPIAAILANRPVSAGAEDGAKRAAAGIAAVILGLHVLGFGLLALGATGALTIGVGLSAYALGLRHAFDPDHLAAIDNATRKLIGEGRRPLGVGFFFSLGHSTVVFVLALLLALGVRAVGGQLADEGSALQVAGGWIGTGASVAFLLAVAALNVVLLIQRRGEGGGLLYRLYGRFTGLVSRPRQMYPVGLLFGLGFDTATEVALLLLAAGAAGAGLPFYAILCLPLLFAAGMSLLDTLQGSAVGRVYRWACGHPARRLRYDLAVTGVSIVAALAIAATELAGPCGLGASCR
jgi:nickel/cobalt transporter (NiCoT) family protein